MALLTFVVFIASPLLAAASGSWISLDISGQSILTDESDVYYSTVPVTIGTPQQEVDMTLNTYSTLLATFAYDCNLCAGSTFFDHSQSSTFASSNRTWTASSNTLTGSYFEDTIGFGNLVTDKTDFVLIENMALNMTPRLQNGNLGLFVDNSNSTEESLSYFSRLWDTGKLLNPVIGMRFNPENPKLTIGALDPADYEGQINWVQLETPNESWDLLNLFKIDGFKGYNGSFFPYGANSSTLAGINSVFNNIAVPNNYPYMANVGYRGPVTNGVTITPKRPDFAYQCNETTPYVSLTTVINGVDYQIDSKDNLLHPTSIFQGMCNIGFQNATLDGQEPGVTLGLAFLRSVYVAYRFPTDNCPGYYGFAFPKGANRTSAQIAQTPTSTPSSSSQCLSLTAPTSTPTLSAGSATLGLSSNTYSVYGRPGAAQVQLIGVDDLPKGVWDQPQPE